MTDLRALTVRQPHADLIMAGVKDVENRSWPVPSTLPQWGECDYHGRVAPYLLDLSETSTGDYWRHWPGDGYQCPVDLDGPFPFRLGIHAAANVDHQAPTSAWAALPTGLHRRLSERYGVLLGTVEVTGCHHADECRRDRPIEDCSSVADLTCSRWAEPGDVWHWTLTDPRSLYVPIPMRGMLGLWRLEFVEMAP